MDIQATAGLRALEGDASDRILDAVILNSVIDICNKIPVSLLFLELLFV